MMTDSKHIDTETELRWYAMRALKRKVFKIKEDFENLGFETYMAMRREMVQEGDGVTATPRMARDVQIIPQLLFVRCPVEVLNKYKQDHFSELVVYRSKVRNSIGEEELRPAAIPEDQMQAFILITSAAGGKDIEYYGETMPQIEEGQLVRVKEGIYKGATGVVKRIKRDRKLLVRFEGIAVVAISNIPMSYIEKV